MKNNIPKSTPMAIAEGIICFTVLLTSMDMILPGFSTRIVLTYCPPIGKLIVLVGLGKLLMSLNQSNEKPYKIMETIFRRNNIYTKDGDEIYYPILIEKAKTESGWFLLYKPPFGMSVQKFIDNQDAFNQALGEVEIQAEGGLINVNVHQRKLRKKIDSESWLKSGRN